MGQSRDASPRFSGSEHAPPGPRAHKELVVPRGVGQPGVAQGGYAPSSREGTVWCGHCATAQPSEGGTIPVLQMRKETECQAGESAEVMALTGIWFCVAAEPNEWRKQCHQKRPWSSLSA